MDSPSLKRRFDKDHGRNRIANKSKNEQAAKNNSALWQNLDDGKYFKVNEMTGEQVLCDSRGIDIKKFNSKITGRYNYDDRKLAMIKAKAGLGDIEVQIKHMKRNHIPQHQRLDGYAQMPRMIAPPYSNSKLQTHIDGVRKQRAQRANNSIQRERMNSSLTNTGESIITQIGSPTRINELKRSH